MIWRKYLGVRWLVAGALVWAAITPSRPLADESPNLRGIDVSHFSGAVNWAEVEQAGFSFVFVKATEGEDALDPHFHDHWTSLAESDLKRGAYHFYVTEDDPVTQAKFFIAQVELGEGDLVPVVDIETLGHGTTSGLASRLQQFLALLENHYGVRPILYTSPRFWNTHLNAEFGDYPLWVAEYEVKAPRLPEGWSAWNLWQFEENATVEGVEKGADLSVLKGPLTALTVPAHP